MSTNECKPQLPGLKPISLQRAKEIAFEHLRKVVPPEAWNAIPGEHQQVGQPLVTTTAEPAELVEPAKTVESVEGAVPAQRTRAEDS